MLPCSPIPLLSGGPEQVVEMHNAVRTIELKDKYCLSTYPLITTANIQVIDHLVLESDILPQGLHPLIEFGLQAGAKGDAVMYLKKEITYERKWFRKKPAHMKMSGDIVKINYGGQMQK